MRGTPTLRHERVGALLRRDVAAVVLVEGAERGSDLGELRRKALLDDLVHHPKLLVRDATSCPSLCSPSLRAGLCESLGLFIASLGLCDGITLLLLVVAQRTLDVGVRLKLGVLLSFIEGAPLDGARCALKPIRGALGIRLPRR